MTVPLVEATLVSALQSPRLVLAGTLVLPLVTGVLLAAIGPAIGRRLPPAAAVPLLTVAALAVSAATGFTMAVSAFLLAAQLPWVSAVGGWSGRQVGVADPFPAAVAVGAGAAVVALATLAVRRAVRVGLALRATHRTCRQLPVGADHLVVLDDDEPDAYAVPGAGGRIVVSTAMLRALTGPERSALLAHEFSHLRRRHYVYSVAVQLAAAANPPLRRLVPALEFGLERWADEDAAAATGDRQLVARALARAGLAQNRPHQGRRPNRPPEPALRATGTAVARRVRALLQPAPRLRPALALALSGIGLAAVVSGLLAGHVTETVVEHARPLHGHSDTRLDQVTFLDADAEARWSTMPAEPAEPAPPVRG